MTLLPPMARRISMSDGRFVRHVYILSKVEGKELDEDVIRAHVAHMRELDSRGILEQCGPFSDGRGGMVILKGCKFEEAWDTAEADPYVSGGYETFDLRKWDLSTEENNHMGMG
jgi:uncharacterized protein YciI